MTDGEEDGFGARLRAIAPNRGDLRKLAEKTDINVRTLTRWASGQGEPQVTELRKIAIAEDVRLEWLVTGRGAMRDDAVASTAPAEARMLVTDHRLIGRLTEKIMLVYKEMGFSVALHQVAERAAVEHDRIVATIADPDERLIQIGEVAAELRHELRAKAADPTTSKRQA